MVCGGKTFDAVRWHSYSHPAARFFLQVVVLVLGGAALGHFLAPGIGAGVGSGIGIALLLVLIGRDRYRRRRGEAWICAGRALGLKPLYSGHMPELPFTGLEEPANALGCEVPTGRLLIADRTERFLVVHRSSSAGDLDFIGTDDHISNPVLIETFVAVLVSGAELPTLEAGQPRGFGSRGAESQLAALGLPLLADWLQRHPGWRIESTGEFLVASRPRKLATPDDLPELIEIARDLAERLAAHPTAT